MYSDKVCPRHPTIYEPCPLEHDPAPSVAVGGVDWTREASTNPAINPNAGRQIKYRVKEIDQLLRERLGRDYNK